MSLLSLCVAAPTSKTSHGEMSAGNDERRRHVTAAPDVYVVRASVPVPLSILARLRYDSTNAGSAGPRGRRPG